MVGSRAFFGSTRKARTPVPDRNTDISPADSHAAQTPARRRLGLGAWCLYDWANSAFNTVIGTFIFSVYFARGIYGDETDGAAVWGYAIGVAGLAVALLSPVLGSIADRGGRRKPWILFFLAVTVTATAMMWFAEPDDAFVIYALVLIIIASVAFELGSVFYNAMLPTIAPPGMIGRISGWGWAMGYAGGLACLAACLFLLVQAETPIFGFSTENAENVRATALLVAVWFTVFAIPLFLFTPDTPPTGEPMPRQITRGLSILWHTLKQIRQQANLVRFLIASALYRDGLSTLFAVGGLYAAGTFGLTFEQILMFAIGLNVTAGLGAAGFAFIDDWVGPKPTILVALSALVGLGITILAISDATLFIVLALALGTFVGPTQAASRSMMARMAPKGMETEMFGLYALAGKSISFIGPVMYGVATSLFQSQRAGMATIVLALAAGGAILMTVAAPPRDRPEGTVGPA